MIIILHQYSSSMDTVHVRQKLDIRKIELKLKLISMARAIPILYLQRHRVMANKKKDFISLLDCTQHPSDHDFY